VQALVSPGWAVDSFVLQVAKARGQVTTEREALSKGKRDGNGGGWRVQVLRFALHLATVYAITTFCTSRLAVWTHGTLLPLLREPSSSTSSEFLFSHLLAFSFVPAFTVGLINARFKHKVAQFVWLVPTVILFFKFLSFRSTSVLHSQLSLAFHHYFGGGFLIPEFRDWHDFWTTVGSNSDLKRAMAQLSFTAPFYAGIGYSVATWIGRRTNLIRKVSEKVKYWEDSRFKGQRSRKRMRNHIR
jgi:hypothetical protein